MALPVPTQLGAMPDWRESHAMRMWMIKVSEGLQVQTSSNLYINVTDPLYGATGDGVTDDTVAIASAMAAANTAGRGLYFPAGTYLTDVITVQPNVPLILGDGPGKTTIKPTRVARAAATVLFNMSASTVKATLTGMLFDVQDAVFDGTYVIKLGANALTVQNVDVTGRAAFAVFSDAGSGCRVQGMRITGVGGNGFTAGVYAQGSSSELQVHGVTQSGDHAYCVNISSGAFNLVNACTSYAQGSATGVFGFVLSLCTYSDIVNCFSLDSYHEAFQMTDTNYCRIMGCTAQWSAAVGSDFGISINGTVASGPATHNQVIGNAIYNSFKSGVAVAGNSRNCLVASNTLADTGYREGAGGALLLAYTANAGETCSGHRFSDNYCYTSGGTATNGVLESQAGGSTVNSNIYDRNTLVGYTTRYTLVGAASLIIDHEWQTWTPTITNTGGGGFTYTIQSSRYQLNGKGCSGYIVFTVTAAGGGGYITIPLPFAAVSGNAGVATGFETTTAGIAVGGSIGPANINNLRTYNNAATAVLNYKIYLTFNYEMA